MAKPTGILRPKTNLTDLPEPTDAIVSKPSLLTRLLAKHREALQVLRGDRGDPLDAAITWRSALANGIVTGTAGGITGTGGGIGGGGGGSNDHTPPPDVTGLTASAGISHVIVEFDAPVYLQGGGNARTNIYAVQRDPASTAALPTFTDAVIVGSASGASPILSVPSNPDTKWFVWAKYETVAGVESVNPAGGVNGVQCTTGQDVSTLLNALTQAAEDPASPYDILALRADLFTLFPHVNFYQDTTPTGTVAGQLWFQPSTGLTFSWTGSAWSSFPVNPPFFVVTTTIVNNGVSCPPGVYIQNAYIANGTITNVMIGNAVIDDAKITDLSAAKITAGSIAVGEYIQSTGYVAGVSGWKINGSGVAEFSGVIVRGTIYATAGQIGGATIDATGVQSGSYVAGSAGWRLDNASGTMFGASVQIKDATGTRILNTSATGTAYVMQIGSVFWVKANGDAFFGGKLSFGSASVAADSGIGSTTNIFGSGVNSINTGNLVLIPSGSVTNSGNPVTVNVNITVTVISQSACAAFITVQPTIDGVAYGDSSTLPRACLWLASGAEGGYSFSVETNFGFTAHPTPAAGTHSYGVIATVNFRDSAGGVTSPASSGMTAAATCVIQENLA